MNIPIHQFPLWVWTVLGLFSIVLSMSFLHKAWNAAVFGRCHYWDGFLPFTLISPWFIHLKPSDNSLIKTKQGMLCHMLIGPLLFLTALPLLVVGLDLTGLNGTKYTNLILNLGNPSYRPAIIYSAPISYKFPILASSSRRINDIFVLKKINQNPNEVLVPETSQSAKSKYAK